MQSSAILVVAFFLVTCASSAAQVASPQPSPPPPLATTSPTPAGSASATPQAVPSGFATPVACDDAGFLALEAQHPSGYHEVTVCGNVAQVLPERTTASGRHKYYFVTVDAAGDTIEIITNVDETGEFDVRVGALANVHGRYFRDSIGTQGIDWTHHNSAGASWPFPGYVQLDGGRLID